MACPSVMARSRTRRSCVQASLMGCLERTMEDIIFWQHPAANEGVKMWILLIQVRAVV